MSTNAFKARVKGAGSHYFDPQTMRFFNSVLHRTRQVDADRVYFVTSEQQDHLDGTVEPRAWSVRVAQFSSTPTGETVNVDTAEGHTFQEFTTQAAAVKAMHATADLWQREHMS